MLHQWWAQGLPVIPLRPKSKRPIVDDWSKWCREPIPDGVKEQWLTAYPESNIGLPLGPSAGLIAIDVDTTDPHLITLIEKLLPPSPWKRTGKKGFVHLYKLGAEKTEQIKDENGGVILELLFGRGARSCSHRVSTRTPDSPTSPTRF